MCTDILPWTRHSHGTCEYDRQHGNVLRLPYRPPAAQISGAQGDYPAEACIEWAHRFEEAELVEGRCVDRTLGTGSRSVENQGARNSEMFDAEVLT